MQEMNGAQLRADSGAQEVILLLGDWLVDEYWVFGVHRSSTASRTGDAHLRSLHQVQGNVQAFCGAGRSAYFLHQLYRRDNGSPQTAIVGLGFWHRNDTAALAALFDPSANPNNLFRMMTHLAAPPPGVDLINMNEAWNFEKDDAHRDKYEYTTRIIRVFHAEPKRGGWEYDRLDWEPRLRPLVWTAERLAHLQEQLTTQLRGRKVRAVVVKDMRKGAVNPEIIDWLIHQVETDTPWYVSTKQWNPTWLDKLAAVPLKLYMIPPVAAREAIRREELSCWLVPSGKPSNEAIRLIERIASKSRAETIFILPEGLSALMYSGSGRSTCVVQTAPAPRKITVDMGGASIVFPALVAYIEHGIEGSLKTVTSVALETTREWLGFEEQRIVNPQGWNPDHIRPGTVLDALRNSVQGEPQSDMGDREFGDIREMEWGPLKKEWHQALKSETGVVTASGGAKEFQLWRAMLEVNGYICCDEKKRKQLRKMLLGIRNFAETAKHHVGCMLVAGPGTGKSFLAKRLADAAHLDFIAFNITQMQTRGDIIKCFEIISEQAASDSHRRLLVFMDEINALLDREKPYSTFLTPLEDGTYVHNGQTAKIPPCVWVFAGTEHPDQRPDKAEHGTKVSDFVSRLALGVFDFGTASAPKMAALERVYVGISLLKAEFPEVDRVSEAVIRAFHHLPNAVKGRDIKNFVRRFRDIQYGTVTARSVPESDWPGGKQYARLWKAKGYSDVADIHIVAAK